MFISLLLGLFFVGFGIICCTIAVKLEGLESPKFTPLEKMVFDFVNKYFKF